MVKAEGSKHFRLGIFLILLAVLILSQVFITYAETNISVLVDGTEIQFDQPPINENGRVMVPLRYVAEALGWEVSVEPDGVIRIRQNLDTVRYSTFIDLEKAETINVITSNQIHLLYETKPMEPKPKLVNGRTLVGIRYLTESLYAKVDWDEKTQTVFITSQTLPYSDIINPIPVTSEQKEITANVAKPDDAFEIAEQTDELKKTEERRQQQTEFELELIERVNAERVNVGLREVRINPELMAVARWKAEEMYNLDYFSHTSPTLNLEHTELVRSFGIYCTYAGENITASPGAVVMPVAAMGNWMRSTGHKANILREKATDIGVGYWRGYWSLFMMY